MTPRPLRRRAHGARHGGARNQDSGQFLADVESIGLDSILEQAVERATPLFDEYPDRIMWGSDFGVPWHYDPAVQNVVFNISRSFIARLPEEVQEDYAFHVFGRHLTPSP